MILEAKNKELSTPFDTIFDDNLYVLPAALPDVPAGVSQPSVFQNSFLSYKFPELNQFSNINLSKTPTHLHRSNKPPHWDVK